MRILLIGIAWWAVACVLLIAQLLRGQPESPKPLLLATPEVYDAGACEQGDTLECVFRLFNGGSAPVFVFAVTANCSCTLANNEPRMLEPEEAWKLPVAVRTDHYAGPIVKSVSLGYQLPGVEASKRLLVLKVKADVYAPRGRTSSPEPSTE